MADDIEGDISTQLMDDGGSNDGDTTVLMSPTTTGTAGRVAANNHALWSLAFYQAYFDVDTGQVLKRIKLASLPLKETLIDHMQTAGGDLYGPFWISTTLIFVLAISGNLAHYRATPEDKREAWHYNFSKVSVAATVIYAYVTLMPFIVWLWFRIKAAEHRPNIFDVFCLYGYSLAPYAPVALLCAFPFVTSAGQWVLLALVFASTSAVVLKNLLPNLKKLPSPLFLLTLAILLGANAALCIAFKFYFFVY